MRLIPRPDIGSARLAALELSARNADDAEHNRAMAEYPLTAVRFNGVSDALDFVSMMLTYAGREASQHQRIVDRTVFPSRQMTAATEAARIANVIVAAIGKATVENTPDIGEVALETPRPSSFTDKVFVEGVVQHLRSPASVVISGALAFQESEAARIVEYTTID